MLKFTFPKIKVYLRKQDFMEKEDFASVRTIAIYNFNDAIEEERFSFEDVRTLLNGFPQYMLNDKNCLVVYNPIFSLVQKRSDYIIDQIKYNFNKFLFVKLNMDDFSYDKISLERNAEWDDAEKIRCTIPYPPKYAVVNSVHEATQASNYNELYEKLSEELNIPIWEHSKKIKNLMLKRSEAIHHEDPQMLLQRCLDEKISAYARFCAQRRLYGDAKVIE